MEIVKYRRLGNVEYNSQKKNVAVLNFHSLLNPQFFSTADSYSKDERLKRYLHKCFSLRVKFSKMVSTAKY